MLVFVFVSAFLASSSQHLLQGRGKILIIQAELGTGITWMAHLLTLRLKTGMFDESHIDIINTFEMHLSQGDLFTGKKIC